MIIAGVDTETTGFEESSEVIEFGYCIYDTSNNVILSCGSDIFVVDNWDASAEECSSIHHITKPMTEIAGLKPSGVDYASRILAYHPSVIIAHNAPFDYGKIKKHWPKLCELPWLCSQRDFDHSKFTKATTRRLMYLAIEYGIPVVGWHRAAGDAEIACLIAAKHDIDAALELKNMKKHNMMVIGPYDASMRELLPKLGFRFTKDPITCYIKEDILADDLVLLETSISEIIPRGWRVESAEAPPRGY